MGVVDILEIGKQGMDTNRQALQTTSNNIANANTPGYSRQRAVLSTNEQPTQGQVKMNGVQVKQTIRVHDRFVQNQIVDEYQVFGSTQARAQGLKRVESMVHNDAYRVGDLLNGFFNDFRELSANPEVNALRSNVTFSAQEAVNGFRSLSNNLVAVKDDLDMQISVNVETVNTLAKEVADLNGKIAHFEARGDEPLELLDRRDAAVREIAQKLGFQDFVGNNDEVNITAGGLGVLVNGTTVNELVVMRTPAKGDKTSGSYDIFVKDGEGLREATRFIQTGEIGGLIHVRDKVVNPSLKHLDHIAHQFGNSINAVHRQGVGSDGKSGRNMFDLIEGVEGAAQTIRISNDIATNASAIAVGATPNAPGDNRVALQIAEMQNAGLLSDDPASDNGGGPSRQTFNDSLTGLVGRVAVQVEHEQHMFKHQEAIVNQLETYRQSISGVNLDEEAMSMMQYQAAFNASAKALKVGDDLLQTILSLRD